MTIESFKKDKMMKPYFLWFLKSNLMMPKVNGITFIENLTRNETTKTPREKTTIMQ